MTRHHSSSLRGPRPRPSDTPPPSKRLRHPHPPTLPTPWIIPARAGFTPRCQSWCACRWDHPRSRGVYSLPASPAPPIRGSSPLARGLLCRSARPVSPGRIIPARAGFTSPAGRSAHPAGDHPRSRGVYLSFSFKIVRISGSSPLARGLHPVWGVDQLPPRIIPARAGFTPRSSVGRRRSPDHPRSRGVYSCSPSLASWRTGSSLLARGLLRHVREQGRHDGIIPARAGFTGLPYGVVVCEGDHPRSRGVYWDVGADPVNACRIIPARAGFTALRAPWLVVLRDHPRSRGVYRGG